MKKETQKSDEIIDLSRLRQISGGDEAFARELIEIFNEDNHLRLERMREASGTDDWETCEFEAHGIKGASANVGAKKLSELPWRFENSSRQRNHEAIAEGLNQIEAEFKSLQNFVSRKKLW